LSEALANIARKKANLLRAQQATAEALQRYREKEATAEEALENVVAFVLTGKHATLTAVARELNCSRDKVRAMAERARRRTMQLLRSGHDD
jgi:glutamate racemase